jgi:hypothetical protein
MEQCLGEYFLAAIVDVEYVPLVDESIVTERVTEDILNMEGSTMIKQMKKE